MAYRKPAGRRFANFKRRSISSRLHTPTRPVRWQAANFCLNGGLVMDANGADNNLVIVLATIGNRVGDSNTAQGRTLNSMARSMEIGGVVMEWSFRTTLVFASEPVGSDQNAAFQTQVILCSDRLQADDQPASIDCNWFTNTPPISTALSTEDQDRETNYPTRIHLRRSHRFDVGFTDPPSVLGTLRSAGVTTYASGGRANLRLKLRLSDEQALCIHVPSQVTEQNEATINEIATDYNITGTLYYRARF